MTPVVVTVVILVLVIANLTAVLWIVVQRKDAEIRRLRDRLWRLHLEELRRTGEPGRVYEVPDQGARHRSDR